MSGKDGNTEALQTPRRFYRAAGVQPAPGGYAIRLDGRGARTPAGAPLVVPTQPLAELLAAEWEAQGDYIQMASMRAVRLAFTAIDRVADARAEVAEEVARYAGSDMLCYFADFPTNLVERQVKAWGPVLQWADESLQLHLARTTGVTHVTQPVESLLRVAGLAAALDDFALAGLAHATALFGSAVLALALQRDKLDGEAAFELSRLDEAFQAEQWGLDEEAAFRAEGIRAEALMLERWFRAL